MFDVTPIYAALVALLYIRLAFRVIGLRRSLEVGIGDADNTQMKRAIRAHANLSEYAPMMLILLGAAELQGTPDWVLHLFGLAIIASRLVHAWGISQQPEPIRIRIYTMATTFGVLGLLALGNLAHALF